MYILSSLPDCRPISCTSSHVYFHLLSIIVTYTFKREFNHRSCHLVLFSTALPHSRPPLKKAKTMPWLFTRRSRHAVVAGHRWSGIAASPCQKATAAQRERWSRRESVVPRRFVAVCNQKRVQKVVIESPSLLMGPSVSGHLEQTLQSAG